MSVLANKYLVYFLPPLSFKQSEQCGTQERHHYKESKTILWCSAIPSSRILVTSFWCCPPTFCKPQLPLVHRLITILPYRKTEAVSAGILCAELWVQPLLNDLPIITHLYTPLQLQNLLFFPLHLCSFCLHCLGCHSVSCFSSLAPQQLAYYNAE